MRPQALDQLLTQATELYTYTVYFVSAKADGIKLSVRQVVVWAVLGMLMLIAATSVIVTAIVLLLTGLAGALAGQLIVSCGWARWSSAFFC